MFTEDELDLIFDLVDDALHANVDWLGRPWNEDDLVTQTSILAKIRQIKEWS